MKDIFKINLYTFRIYRFNKKDDSAMEKWLDDKHRIPKYLDLNNEEAKDCWVASRLERLGVVMQQALMANEFWHVIFKTIPAWCDMVRKQ